MGWMGGSKGSPGEGKAPRDPRMARTHGSLSRTPLQLSRRRLRCVIRAQAAPGANFEALQSERECGLEMVVELSLFTSEPFHPSSICSVISMG